MSTVVNKSMQIAALQGRTRAWTVLSALFALALLSFVVAGVMGSVTLSLGDIADAMRELLQGAASSMAATLVELRLSRALSAFVTGASLTLAGVMMQALLRLSLIHI